VAFKSIRQSFILGQGSHLGYSIGYHQRKSGSTLKKS
jgi:hypothetical protein